MPRDIDHAAPQSGMRAEGEALRELVDQTLYSFENDGRTLYPDNEVIIAIENIRAALPAASPAAPSSPAPDAMRKIITVREELINRKFEWCIIEIVPERHRILHNFGGGADAMRLAQSTLASAPVPPPDGAAEARDTQAQREGR